MIETDNRITLTEDIIPEESLKEVFYLSARKNITPQEAISAIIEAAFRNRSVIAELLKESQPKKPAA